MRADQRHETFRLALLCVLMLLTYARVTSGVLPPGLLDVGTTTALLGTLALYLRRAASLGVLMAYRFVLLFAVWLTA